MLIAARALKTMSTHRRLFAKRWQHFLDAALQLIARVGRVTKFDNRVTLKTTKQKEAEADLEFVFRAEMIGMPIPDYPQHKVPALILDTDPADGLVAALSHPDFIVGKLEAEGPMTRKQLKEAFCSQFGKSKD